MHVPVETAREARSYARELDADGCVAIGGGSSIGLAKAIALEIEHPDRRHPDDLRRIGDDPDLRPQRSWREGDRPRSPRPASNGALRPGADAAIAAASLRALGDERARALRRSALRAGRQPHHHAASPPRAFGRCHARCRRSSTDPANLEARTDALYGAWLGGMALGAVGMAIHHKLCHTLGGSFNLPHAEVHSVILPHAAAFNREAASAAMRYGCRRARHTDAARRPVRSRGRDWRADFAEGHRHAGRRSGSGGRRSPRPIRTTTRGRSTTPVCARCSTTPSTADDREPRA